MYDDSAFSGALSITQLTFYNTVLPGGTPVPGAFQIYLQATSQQVGGISVNFPDVSGATLVFDGAIPLLSNGRLDFSLSQSFNYDPAKARRLLVEAGYPDGLETTLSYCTCKAEYFENLAVALKDHLARAGIRVAIEKYPGARFGELLIGLEGCAGIDILGPADFHLLQGRSVRLCVLVGGSR